MWIPFEGVRLWAREAGADRGRDREKKRAPLLLVHGAGATSAVWLGVMRRLGRLRRTVAYDLPGHGRSGDAARVTFEAYTETILAVSLASGLARPIVVGHSLGGALALAHAAGRPADTAGLVLVTTGATLPVPADLPEELETRFARAVQRLGAAAFSPATDREVARRTLAGLFASPAAVVARDFRMCRTVDLRPRLREVRCPCLVIAGEDDRLTPPALSEYLADTIPGARLECIPRAGHLPFIEQEEAFSNVLSAFVNQLG